MSLFVILILRAKDVCEWQGEFQNYNTCYFGCGQYYLMKTISYPSKTSFVLSFFPELNQFVVFPLFCLLFT